MHQLLGELFQRLASISLPQLAEYRQHWSGEPGARVNGPKRVKGGRSSRLDT